MQESSQGFAWLYTTLSGDTTISTDAPGGVWLDMAPDNTATPFIVIQHQAGHDMLAADAHRFAVSDLFQVKVVGPTSGFSTLATVADRIDTLLGRTNGTTASATITACYREQEFTLSELVNGTLWTNVGGLYRLIITP